MAFLPGKTVGGGGMALNRQECRRALEVLLDPGEWVELRGLYPPPNVSVGGSVVRPAGDLAGLVEAAAKMSAGGLQVYYTLNPVRADLDHKTRVTDVLRRRWLLFDIDPEKVPEHKDDSATDAEKERTREVAGLVVDWLASQDWPAPVVIDSGNGVHLLYRVDLPANAHTHALFRRLLHTAAERFAGRGAQIDRSVCNASRISKLPGSWAMKGQQTDDRPWRPVRLVHVPERVVPVSAELIQTAGKPLKDEVPANSNGHGNGFLKGRTPVEEPSRDWAQAALDGEVARVVLALPGPAEGRNNALNRAAFSLGQLVGGGELDEQRVTDALADAASRAGLGEAETAATIKSGLESGKASPRKRPEKRQAPAAADAIPKGESIIVRASTITPRKIEWLWPARIPLGKMTTFAGQGGLGKTFVLCDISARVTQGLDWPDSVGVCCEQGQVLFITGEDDFDDTIVPRLIELGADLERVAFLRNEVQDKFTIGDLKTLDAALDAMGPGTRLVVIDPPASFLGEADDHKNAEVRSLLTPLKTWCARRRVAIVFNTHFNKAGGAKVEAMQRVMASVAWVNAVRTAHAFAADPDEDGRVIFVPMKTNVGKKVKGLAYRIVGTRDDLARVEWLGEVDTTADRAVNSAPEKKKRKVVASEWLAELLPVGGEEVPSKAIWKAADETTLSRNAIIEAKEEMGVKAKQATVGDESRQWVWYWPPPARQRWEEKQKQRGGADEQAF